MGNRATWIPSRSLDADPRKLDDEEESIHDESVEKEDEDVGKARFFRPLITLKEHQRQQQHPLSHQPWGPSASQAPPLNVHLVLFQIICRNVKFKLLLVARVLLKYF